MITSDEFLSLLKKHFSFLEESYGFKFENIGDYDYFYEARISTTRIFFALDRHEVEINIEPINDGAKLVKEQGYRPRSISVERLAEAFGAEIELSWDPTRTPKQLDVEFREFARLLEQYCKPMLQGDFSDWYKYENFISGR